MHFKAFNLNDFTVLKFLIKWMMNIYIFLSAWLLRIGSSCTIVLLICLVFTKSWISSLLHDACTRIICSVYLRPRLYPVLIARVAWHSLLLVTTLIVSIPRHSLHSIPTIDLRCSVLHILLVSWYLM